MNAGFSTAALSSRRLQRGIAWSILRALLYAMVFVAIVTFFLYLGLSLDWIKLTLLRPIYQFCNYFVVLAGAVIAGFFARGRGWFVGMVFGTAYFILAALIAPAWGGQNTDGSVFFMRFGIALILGAVGGMIGVNL